ncbi:hypothetical protein GCM10018966_102370 [Streptomyces yanii]
MKAPAPCTDGDESFCSFAPPVGPNGQTLSDGTDGETPRLLARNPRCCQAALRHPNAVCHRDQPLRTSHPTQLSQHALASRHPGGKCSRGGFLSGNAARRVEGEAQFVECWGKRVGDVVIRLRACARGQEPQNRTVEVGNECIQRPGPR